MRAADKKRKKTTYNMRNMPENSYCADGETRRWGKFKEYKRFPMNGFLMDFGMIQLR